MRCYSCKATPPSAPWHPSPCCRDATWELGNWEFGPQPDVAQWLRTRAIRVAWLIRAARHVPGLTVDAR